MKFIWSLLLVMSALVCNAQQKPIPILFDSDMGPDYDDVGALTILHALADSAQVEILATVASTTYPEVTQVFDVINTYFGRPNIPIGVPKAHAIDKGAFQHWPDTLVKKYPHDVVSNDGVADALDVYRKVLAGAANKSVTIVSVGFFTNLANLLNSKPDQYSTLNGKELVAKKVKQLVCMGGQFPVGNEYNVRTDVAASRIVAEQWPVTIIFSGVEIGNKIHSGLALTQEKTIHNDPVKDVYSICIPLSEEDTYGRRSWDQTAVIVAAKGASTFYNLNQGRIIIASDGSNTWDATKKGHFYITEKADPAVVERYINKMMMHHK